MAPYPSGAPLCENPLSLGNASPAEASDALPASTTANGAAFEANSAPSSESPSAATPARVERATTASLADTGLSISGGAAGADYVIDPDAKKVIVTSEKPLTLSGTSQGYTLEIAAGNHATLVLDNVTIEFSRDDSASPDKGRIPLNIATNLMDKGGSERDTAATEGDQITNKTSLHLLLADSSTNTFTGSYGTPGIRCGEGSVLVIDDAMVNYDNEGNHIVPSEGRVPADLTLANGTTIKKGDPLYTMDSASPGKLIAQGGCGGAGIGSAPHENAGAITIDGGIIEAAAYGNDSFPNEDYSKTGAGIGGSYGGGATDTTINGGIVVARGSFHGAGIGAGCTSDPAATTNSVPAYDKDILPGIMRTREYKAGQKCRNITVNGGDVEAWGYIHGFALGEGCAGQPNTGCSLTIRGGNLTPQRDRAGASSADKGGYLGASGLDIIVQGGSFNVPYFGFESSPSSTLVSDGRGNTLTMVEIDLAGYEGLQNSQLKSLTVTIGGAPITDADGNPHRYGLPYGVDANNKVYFWLPSTANGKEVAIKDFVVSSKNPDGTRTETDSKYPFVVPSAGNGATAKRYVEINIDDYVAKTPGLHDLLYKRYDGVPIGVNDDLKQTIANFKVPADEPKNEVIDDPLQMELSSHRIADRSGNPTTDAVVPGGSFTDAGTYQVIIESTEWSADANFSKSFWGHKLYLSSIIDPADSETSVTTHTLDYGTIDGAADKLTAVNLTANVTPRTKTSSDGLPAEATTCEAPDGKLQFYANGVPIGEPVELVAAGKTPSGYASSGASYVWSDFKRYQIPANNRGTIVIQGKYLGGSNFNESVGASTEIPAEAVKDIPTGSTPEITVKPQNPDPNAPPVPELKPEGPPTSGPADPEAEDKDIVNTLHSTVRDSYCIPADENGSPLGPDDLLAWAESRYGIPDGCTMGPVAVEHADGTPADAVIVSQPGNFVLRIPVKDKSTGNTTTIIVDLSVVNPPIVNKPDGPNGTEKKPLIPDKVTEEPNRGTVHGEASDVADRPVRPGVTDTPDSIKEWIESYYDIPPGSTVSTPVLKDENGNPVDAIDGGTPGRWIVEFTVTDEKGNTTTVTVDYGISAASDSASGGSNGNTSDDGEERDGKSDKKDSLRMRLAQTGDSLALAGTGALFATLLTAAALALARRRLHR